MNPRSLLGILAILMLLAQWGLAVDDNDCFDKFGTNESWGLNNLFQPEVFLANETEVEMNLITSGDQNVSLQFNNETIVLQTHDWEGRDWSYTDLLINTTAKTVTVIMHPGSVLVDEIVGNYSISTPMIISGNVETYQIWDAGLLDVEGNASVAVTVYGKNEVYNFCRGDRLTSLVSVELMPKHQGWT